MPDESYIPCLVPQLPADLAVTAAETAVSVNPANAAPQAAIAMVSDMLAVLHAEGIGDGVMTPGHLSLLTSKYWGPGGVHLTVSFMDNAPADLRDRILSHANAWGQFCNVKFSWVQSQGQIRIARNEQAYYSYLGIDNLHIPLNQHTMMLGGFTMQTPEAEYRRVVRHEVGHVLGWPHEQQLPEIVARLDPAKTIAWGARVLGWSEAMVRSQILTPLDPRSIRMTAHADVHGIMEYALPAEITKDGNAIPGGLDIDDIDAQFAASLYPLEVPPPPPPKPPDGGTDMLAKIVALIAALKANDWLTAFKLLLDLINSLQSGAIPTSEVNEVHDVMQAMQVMSAPKALAMLKQVPAETRP